MTRIGCDAGEKIDGEDVPAAAGRESGDDDIGRIQFRAQLNRCVRNIQVVDRNCRCSKGMVLALAQRSICEQP